MKEFKITFAKFVVLLGTGLMSSQTVAGEEGPSLKGFQCHALDEQRLNLSPQDVSSGKRLPPVFDARLVGVKRVGVEGDVIYVAWPLKPWMGLRRFFGNDAIRPLHKADGTQGGCRLSRPQNGQITFAFDPGLTAGE